MAVDEKIAVSLAQDVYYEQGRPPLPSGWSVFLNCTIEEQKNSYFGVAYQAKLDQRHASIVIAHRGSDSLGDWVEDVEMCSAAHKVPAQFYTGAIPFIQDVFLKLDKGGYNQTVTYLYFTGHSLGATLSELSIIRYINYFDNWKPTYNPYRIWGNTTYVFESPGSLNLVQEQLIAGEITESDIVDGGKTIEVYNSEVDGINTCMATSASYGRRRIFAAIGNEYSYTWRFPLLPFPPKMFYLHYTLNQHSMSYVYDWVTQVFNRSNPNTYVAIKVSEWPIGSEAALYNYLSYYGPGAFNHNFEKHNLYWQQYTAILWDQSPSLHEKFGNDLSAFQDYYYKTELHYISSYPGNLDSSFLPNQQGFVIGSETPDETTWIDSYSISGVGDVNGDHIPDLLMGLFYINGYAGEAYLVYGGQSSIYLPTFPSKHGFNIKGTPENGNGTPSRAGTSVSGVGDVNGDYIPDMLIGAPGISRGYLIYGGQEGTIDLSTFQYTQGFVMQGQHGFTASSVSAVGDINGDGLPDMLIGDPYLSGVVYVVYGGRGLGVLDLTQFPNEYGYIIKGPPSSTKPPTFENVGVSVSGIGDVDGDNIPDILIGAPGKFPGRAYVVYGKCRGTIELSMFPNFCGFNIDGDANWGPGLGRSVSGVGDVNKDGYPDMLVGGAFTGKYQYCPDPTEYKAAAWLIYGGPRSVAIDLANPGSFEGVKIVSPYCNDWTSTYTDQVGGIVSGVGDVNRDGVPDFLVSFTSEDIIDTPDQAIAYLIYGGFNGTVDFRTFPSERGFIIKQSLDSCLGENGCGSGYVAASAVGDVDRDGTPDIFIGVSGKGLLEKSYLVYGRGASSTIFGSEEREKSSEDSQRKEQSITKDEVKMSAVQNATLDLLISSGKQFNNFYQQAKDYLASFWRAGIFQTKQELSTEQVSQRERALDKILKKLDSLDTLLDLGWYDNRDYLKKVTGFYQKMVSSWKEDVSTLTTKDIRDLQEDINKLSNVVYSPDLQYPYQNPSQKMEQKTPYGFFDGAGINASLGYPALGVQPVLLLP